MAQVRQQEVGLIAESDCVLMIGVKGEQSAVAVISDFAEIGKTVDRLSLAIFERLVKMRGMDVNSFSVGDITLNVVHRMLIDLFKADPSEQKPVESLSFTQQGLQVKFKEQPAAAIPTSIDSAPSESVPPKKRAKKKN